MAVANQEPTNEAPAFVTFRSEPLFEKKGSSVCSLNPENTADWQNMHIWQNNAKKKKRKDKATVKP